MMRMVGVELALLAIYHIPLNPTIPTHCHGMTFSDLSFHQDSPILLIILGRIPLLVHSLSHFRHKGSKAQCHEYEYSLQR